jgi:hypothetical protein
VHKPEEKSEADEKKQVEKPKHQTIADLIKASNKNKQNIIKEKQVKKANAIHKVVKNSNKKPQHKKEINNHVDVKNVQPAKATCLDASRICDTPDFCAEAEYISHPSNCSMYYECVYGYWFTRVCAEGAIFDNTQCLCVNPGEGTCYDECTEPTPGTTVAPGDCKLLPVINQ